MLQHVDLVEHQPYKRQKLSWNVAGGFLLSTSIHVVLLLQFSQMNLPGVEIPHQVTVVEVQLVSMAAAQELPEETQPHEVKAQETVQQERPPSEAEEPPLPEKEPVAEKLKPVKKVVRELFKKPTAHGLNKKNQQPSKLIAAPAPNIATHQPQARSTQQVNQAKQQYLSHIMSVIRAHKIYPYSARRRHIEGDIDVSFVVDYHGQISNLHITGGSPALRKATQRAIEDSLPFSAPPKLLVQTIHPNFIMQYRLK